MTATLVGYVRCSTDRQDLDAQRQALLELGVADDRIYTDHGLNGATRAGPGLDPAPAAVRQGNALVVSKLDRLAGSVPDARAIADQLQERGVKLALGHTLYDPGDPTGKMFLGYPRHLRRVRSRSHPHATGEYSISDLAELFSVSRPTVCRALNRRLFP